MNGLAQCAYPAAKMAQPCRNCGGVGAAVPHRRPRGYAAPAAELAGALAYGAITARMPGWPARRAMAGGPDRISTSAEELTAAMLTGA